MVFEHPKGEEFGKDPGRIEVQMSKGDAGFCSRSCSSGIGLLWFQ